MASQCINSQFVLSCDIFICRDLPLYSGTVNVDVNAMKKGLWIPKDASIGMH